MRGYRSSLFVVVLIAALLVSGIALAHVHDASAPGFQNAQCPYSEFAPRSIDVPRSAPDTPPLYVAPLVLWVVLDAPAPQDLPATASPRAPPQA